MIETLRIGGLALLKDCELEFPPGLTVVSGETGAGKTVLLTSLRILCGGRADSSMVSPGALRTEVDAVATLDRDQATELEEAGYLVDEDQVTFSRTVPREGRSRAAIAGRPVPVKMLTDTVGRTITIHGQSDQWRLKGSGAQRTLLDQYGGPEHRALLDEYLATWERVTSARERFESLIANHDQQQVELQYLRELATAIEELDLGPDEEELIDSAIDRLTNVQELREEVGLAASLFDSDQAEGLVDAIGRVTELLRRAGRQDASLEALEIRASQLEIEAGSLAADLRDYVEGLFDDPAELARLHDRRAVLTDLMRGRAASVSELLDWADNAKRRILELEDTSSDPEAAARQLKVAEEELSAQARRLSESRKTAAKRLENRVGAEIADLGLGNAKFRVEIETQELSRLGQDRVTMMLQAHPSMPPAPISQGASGGELSRIMLALEVALAENDGGKTFVFDEIDAGIGGTTVGSVAARLLDLSKSQQVIVVTHQPQIAAMADANFVVQKSNGIAEVTRVEAKSRTDEIVRMLGGESKAARQHAIDLESRAALRRNKTV